MAQKQHEMKYVISAQASGFTSAFKEAQATLSSTQQKLVEVTKVQADISAYQKQQQAIDKTKQQLELLEKQYDNYQREMDETGQFSAKLANQQDKAAQKARTTEQTLKQQEQALQQLGQALNEAGVDTENLASESERLKAEEAQLVQEGKEAAQSMDQMEQEAKEAAEGLDEVSESADDAGEASGGFGEQATAAIQGVSGLLASAGIAHKLREIYDAFMECASASGDFQQAMSNVEALSGATGNEMNQLTATAKELGATTKFTAEESATAMGYMAMAGWDANQMLSGIDATMALAAASGEDLASVSDIVTDSLTAFGLSASDTAHFADVLAATATSANTSVGIMGETFKYAAPVAGALGYSIEDVSVAIGLMANAGIKGSNAGTALRNVFNGLLGGVELTGQAFGEVTVSAVQADGTMMDFSTTIDTLRGYFNQMTEAERVNNAMTIAGQRGYAGLLSILNATDSDFAKLTSSINDCTGAAQEMADIKLDNLNGELVLMQSAWDGVKIAIGDSLSPVLRDVYGILADVMGEVTEFVNEHPAVVAGIAAFTGVIGTATVALTGIAGAMALASAAGITLTAALPVVGVVVACAAAIGIAAAAIYDTAMAAETATESLERLSGEMTTLTTNESLIAQYQQLTADLQDSSLSAEQLAEKQAELESVTQALRDAYPDLLGEIEAGTKAWDLQVEAIEAMIEAEKAAGKVEMAANVAEGIQDLRRLQDAYNDAEQAHADLQEQMEQSLDFDAEGAITTIETLRDSLAEGLEAGTIEFGDDTFNAQIQEIKTNLESLTGTTVEIDGLADVDYYLSEISAESYNATNSAAHWASENASSAQQVSNAYQALSESQKAYRDLIESGTVTMGELREMSGDTSLSLLDLGITSQDVGEMVATGQLTAKEAMDRYGMSVNDLDHAMASYTAAEQERKQAMVDAAGAADDLAEASEQSTLQMIKMQVAAQAVGEDLLTAEAAADAYGISVEDLNAYMAEQADYDDRVADALALVRGGFMDAETAANAFGVSLDDMKVQNFNDALQNLVTKYGEVYTAAYESMSGQFELWDKAAEVEATSMSTLQSNLESQVSYWQNYNSNLSTVSQAAQDAGIDISGVWDQLSSGSPEAVNAVAGMAAEISSSADGGASSLQSYVDTYQALQDAMGDTAETIANNSSEVIDAYNEMWNAVSTGLEDAGLAEQFQQSASDTIQGYVDGLGDGSEVGSLLSEHATSWLESFNSALGTHSPSTITDQSGQDTIAGFVQGVDGAAPNGVASMQNAANQALAAFRALMTSSALYSAGQNAIQGAINGIYSMIPSLVAAARSAGAQAAAAYKAAQQINSPSKLFEWFSEMDIQGAIQGLEKNQEEANKAFAAAAESGIEAYQEASRDMVELSPYGDAVLNYGTFQANALANQAMQEISGAMQASAKPAEAVGATPYEASQIIITLSPVFNLEGVSNREDLRAELDIFNDQLRDFVYDVVDERVVDTARRGYN